MLPMAFEIIAFAVIVLVLVGDLVLAYRRPHIPSSRESALWIGFYVALALVFAVVLFVVGGGAPAGQFIAGWLTEYSLSVDNLFVFLLIMGRFSVPRQYQQEILMGGIIIALVLRGIFILIGAGLIASFSWIFYLFGAFLIYTAFRQAFGGEQSAEQSEGRFIGWLRTRVRISDEFDGAKLRTVVDGQRMLTPVILVLITLGTTDLLFALDSIPAIFGVTTNSFLVFTANVFALMGLRQLYFLLGNLVEKLVYLTYGIATILAFIGIKLILEAMHGNELPFVNGGHGIEWAPEIPTWLSLVVIMACMAIAVAASLLRIRADSRPGATRSDHRPVS